MSSAGTGLRLVPSGWWSPDYDVYEGDRHLTRLDIAHFRERGTFDLEGNTFDLARESALGDFVLSFRGDVICRAEKPSAFLRSFDVEWKKASLTLRAPSAWRREFVLEKGSDVVGRVAPVGLFSRKALADLPEELPLPIRIFLIWLVLVLWRRAENSG